MPTEKHYINEGNLNGESDLKSAEVLQDPWLDTASQKKIHPLIT